MARRTKLYVDTSVWNFALEAERPESILAYEFLKLIQKQEYQVIISDVVEAEINRSKEPRKSQLINLIESFEIEIVTANEEAQELTDVYIREKLISPQHINDAIHIAVATVHRCDFIVSCNFKHIVKAKVIRGVHLTNLREGYGLIEIVSPQLFLGK